MNGSFFHSLRAAFDMREGARGALACAPLLVLGWALHDPALSWATIGAFWTTLAAVSGPVRQRFCAMLAFAAASTLCSVLACRVAGLGLAAGTVTIFAVAAAAGVARILAPRFYQVAVLSAAACVLTIDQPVSGPEGCHFLVLYVGGCLYATLMGAVVWWAAPPQHDQPEDAPPLPPSHFPLGLGLATAIAYLGVHLAQVRYGYWATIAVLLVLQPSAANTWPRCLERALGTAVGSAVALGLGIVVKNPLVIALAVLPLIGLSLALRTHSYRVFIALLTPAIILVADFAMPEGGYGYAFARLEDNLIGSLIAFAASLLLWPTSGPYGWADASPQLAVRQQRRPEIR